MKPKQLTYKELDEHVRKNYPEQSKMLDAKAPIHLVIKSISRSKMDAVIRDQFEYMRLTGKLNIA